MSGQAPEVILVEDDLVAVMGVERAFAKLAFKNPLRVVRDAHDALALFRGASVASPPARPAVLILDLDLPGLSGLELLEELRRDPGLGETAVFVLTTSRDPSDREAALALGVTGFLVKTNFIDEMRSIASLVGSEEIDGHTLLTAHQP